MNEFDLKIGAQVLCQDGTCGNLAKYAVNTGDWTVTHIIVEDGFLLKEARVFPLSAIERATPAGIQLTCSSEKLEQYPLYREEVVERPDPMQEGVASAWREGPSFAHAAAPAMPVVRESIRYGVPDDCAVIERGTPIKGPEGQVGTLNHFFVAPPGGEITRLVVQQGLLFTTQKVIPAAMVESISEAGISVVGLGKKLSNLPEYRPENEGSDAEYPDHIADDNYVDKDLASRVALALFNAPLTSDAVIEVIDEHGMVTLTGNVDDAETRQAAERIAREQQGVISVVNLLEVAA